jgi:hypothetical protein
MPQFFSVLASKSILGVVVDFEKSENLAAHFQGKDFLLMRNHGILILANDLPTAYTRYEDRRRRELERKGGNRAGEDQDEEGQSKG